MASAAETWWKHRDSKREEDASTQGLWNHQEMEGPLVQTSVCPWVIPEDFSHGLPGLPQFATSKEGSYPGDIMILGINHNLGNPSLKMEESFSPIALQYSLGWVMRKTTAAIKPGHDAMMPWLGVFEHGLFPKSNLKNEFTSQRLGLSMAFLSFPLLKQWILGYHLVN